MKIYAKILLITLPITLVALTAVAIVSYLLSRNALTNLAEEWLTARLDEAVHITELNEETLRRFGLENIPTNVQQAQEDAIQGFATVHIGDQGYVYVVDNTGLIIAHPDSQMVGYDVRNESWFQKMQGTERGRLSYTWLDEKHLATYEYFPPWDWYILATDPQSEVYGTVNQTRLYILLLAGVGIMLLSVSLTFFTQRLVSPLHELTESAIQIGRGDLNVRVAVKTQDEIGTVANTFNQMADQLYETLSTLEHRVTNRTRDLHLAAEIGRQVSQVSQTQSLDDLLAQAVEVIRARFDLYYTQIYLVDDAGHLVLRAGTGDIGAQLLEQGHVLPINTNSVNGRAVVERQSVVVTDTVNSAFFQVNPLLPHTRSELSVPLVAAQRVVGVLNLQGDQPDQLTEENLPAFEALAGQLAIAIENAALFTEREQAVQAVQEEQKRVRTILESIAIPIVISTMEEGIILYMNRPMADIWSRSRDTLIGQTTPDFYDNPESRLEFLHQLRTNGVVTNYEMRLKRNNKESIWALASAYVIDFQNQRAIITSIVDIESRKQAEAAVTRRAAELATVAEVGTAAATLLDPQKLLQEVVDLTKSSFELYHAHIYLLDDTGDTLVLTAGAGEIGRQMVAQGRYIPINQEKSLVARAVRSEQGVIVNDVQADPGFLPNPLLPETRAEMAVPMIAGGVVLGVLDVQSQNIGYFTTEDINIYTTLAAQIAVAQQNAKRHTQTQTALTQTAEQARRLSILNNMSATLTKATNVDTIFKIIGNQITELMHDSIVSVALLNNNATAFEIIVLNGSYGAAATGRKMTLANTGIGLAIRENQIKQFPQDAPFSHFEDTRALAIAGVQSALTIPMVAGSGIIGTLNIANVRPYAYQDEDINFMRQVANLLATNIDSRRLGERARLLASIVENHPDFIGIGTLKGQAIYVNPAGLKMMNLPADHDVQRMDATSFYSEEDAVLLQEEGIPTALETGSWAKEASLRTAGGQFIPVEQTIGINYDAAGQPVSFSITMRDITNRKQAEIAQQQLTMRLEEQLTRVNALQRAMTREGWQTFLLEQNRLVQGYQANQGNVRMITRLEYPQDVVDEETGLPLSANQVSQIIAAANDTASAVAMQVRGEAIGYIGVRDPSGKPIAPATRLLLEEISQQVSESLERARLFEETELARTQTESLYSGSERLLRATTIQEVLQALREATVLKQYDQTTLFIFNRPWKDTMPEIMKVAAVQKKPGAQTRVSVGMEYHMGPPLDQWYQRNRPMIIQDTLTDATTSNVQDMFREANVRSLIVYPLVAGDEWFGVINTENSQPVEVISETDRRQISSLTDQAATVIQSLRLYEAAQEQARHEQMLREVSTKVSAAIDAESVLQTAAREIGRALGLNTFVYLKPPNEAQTVPTRENGKHETPQSDMK